MAFIFYEKTGCKGNARQKALLEEYGFDFEVKSLLDEPWTAETLRPFFGSRPVVEWFNEKAPAVKSGEVDPTSFDEAGALAVMVEEPILIRRPLLDYNGTKACGFDDGVLRDVLGVRDDSTDLEKCQEPTGRCD